MPKRTDISPLLLVAAATFTALVRSGSARVGVGARLALVLLPGFAFVVLAWLASGFYVVQPDQQGVVLRCGAFTGTTAPGLNYHLPWPIESVLLPAVTRVN